MYLGNGHETLIWGFEIEKWIGEDEDKILNSKKIGSNYSYHVFHTSNEEESIPILRYFYGVPVGNKFIENLKNKNSKEKRKICKDTNKALQILKDIAIKCPNHKSCGCNVKLWKVASH